MATRRIIKITVRSVNKVVKLFYATPVLEPITWCVSIPNLKKHQKAGGLVHTAKVKVIKSKTCFNFHILKLIEKSNYLQA